MRSAPPDKIILKGTPEILSYIEMAKQRDRFERENKALRKDYNDFANAFFDCYNETRRCRKEILDVIPHIWDMIYERDRGVLTERIEKIKEIRTALNEIEEAMVVCQDRIKDDLLSKTDDVEGNEV